MRTDHSTSPSRRPSSPDGGAQHGVGPETGVETDRSGCPAPLAWREVVQQFQNQRQVHELHVAGQPLRFSVLGEGPPLYLLSGVLGDSSLFALLIWLMKNEHTCVVFDWPGEVPVPRHPNPQSGAIVSSRARITAENEVSQLAGSVTAAADILGHDRFALHATSFGCLVGLQILLEAPERVERASLQGAGGGRQLTWTERGLLRLARLSGRTVARTPLVGAILRNNHQPWFPPFDLSRWEFFEELAGRTPVRQLARSVETAGRFNVQTRLRMIRTPVLVIACEGDGRVLTQAERELAAALPCASTEYLDNCGFLPHLTHPHRLARLLREFRDGLEGAHAPPWSGRSAPATIDAAH